MPASVHAANHDSARRVRLTRRDANWQPSAAMTWTIKSIAAWLPSWKAKAVPIATQKFQLGPTRSKRSSLRTWRTVDAVTINAADHPAVVHVVEIHAGEIRAAEIHVVASRAVAVQAVEMPAVAAGRVGSRTAIFID